MKRPLVLAFGTIGVLLFGYVLENHFVVSADTMMQQAVESNSASFDMAPVFWTPIISWLLVATAVGGLSWLLRRWADGDRASAIVVALLGGVAWLLPWLYSLSPFASLFPKEVGRFLGPVGFIPISGAFLVVLGLSTLLPRRFSAER